MADDLDRQISELAADIRTRLDALQGVSERPAQLRHAKAMVEIQNAPNLGQALMSAWRTREPEPESASPLSKPRGFGPDQAQGRGPELGDLASIVRARAVADDPAAASMNLGSALVQAWKARPAVSPLSRPRGFDPIK